MWFNFDVAGRRAMTPPPRQGACALEHTRQDASVRNKDETRGGSVRCRQHPPFGRCDRRKFLQSDHTTRRSKAMDKNLKTVLVFTMLYGFFAVGALWAQPHSASLRIADGIGNFEADPSSAIHLALANAE
jgi:hypothetical protein